MSRRAAAGVDDYIAGLTIGQGRIDARNSTVSVALR